jgi:hypothetical protein
MGTDGMTAQAILDSLPGAVKAFREQYGEITASSYGCVGVV